MTHSPRKILTLTTLYPNAAMPTHGVFVENRLRDFHRASNAEIKVIAPVPWFPFKASQFGNYAKFAKVPAMEDRFNLNIAHPRYFIPPRIGMTYAVHSLERCFFNSAMKLLNDGWDFDAIDAHYLYPDGVAATRVAKRIGKPIILTARGSDVSLLPRFPRQRKMILDSVRDADHIVCVASALKEELINLGASPDKISVLRNGVDLDQFRPLNRDTIRTKLGISGFCIASVGHLIERKGHNFTIAALEKIKDATLLIAGTGPEETTLKSLAEKLDLSDRVKFLGQIEHKKLAQVYSAADAFVLASSREGWPNVLLEAMACGTPTIATNIWGNGEVIGPQSSGILIKDRTATAIAKAANTLKKNPANRKSVRAYAENFSWEETSQSLITIFDQCIEEKSLSAKVTTKRLEHPTSMNPSLLMTVDTEEAFDWSNHDPGNHKICDTQDIDRFQTLCENLTIKPLYFLTYPLINDAPTRNYFNTLHNEGRADLGLHLHGWNTPPISEAPHVENSWQCNLPIDLQRAKLKSLSDKFEKAFGFRAIAHRAGRYGIDLKAYAALAEVGISFDFSPCPGFDFSAQGGPDFETMSPKAFRVCIEDKPTITVMPVTGGRGYRGMNLFEISKNTPGYAHPPSKPNRTKLPLRITCEAATIDGILSFTKTAINQDINLMTFSLHSSSMTVGSSPYAKDEKMVNEHLNFITTYIQKFRNELGGKTINLQELVEKTSP